RQRLPPSPPLFPYTTLFRSLCSRKARHVATGARLATTSRSVKADEPPVRRGEDLHSTLDAMTAIPSPSRSFTAADRPASAMMSRSEEHTSELQSRSDLVCRL